MSEVPAGASLIEALLPYHVIPDFLGPVLVARLLDHAHALEPQFRATEVDRRVDPRAWNSLTTHDLGALAEPLTAKMRACAPELFEALKIKPFDIAGIELELIAYNDRAFSKIHIDMETWADPDRRTHRMISAVYYFHGQPKGFTGGALRFHPALAQEGGGRFADIEPVNDTLVAFPAFAPHEVLPVRCPSGVFMDSRFTVYFGLRRAQA